MTASTHSAGRIALIVFTIFIYVAYIVISALSANEVGNDIGLFKNNTGDVSDTFNISITPASWTFTIWAVIYAWQVIWLIYVVTTIFRTDSNGVYIYQLPLLPPIFYAIFILNTMIVAAWLFLWDRQWMGWACLDIVFTPITLFICLAISYWKLYGNLQLLRTTGLTKEIWFIRMFVQNGLAFFATWVSIATILNFTVVLTYIWSVDMQTACIVALSILATDIVVWFILENFFLDRFVRYTFSPYIVFIVGIVGSLEKNFDLENNYTNTVFSAILLVVAATLMLVKLCMIIYRHWNFPIKGVYNEDTKANLENQV